MRRRVGVMALLAAACLLLSACAQTPLTQPPADSTLLGFSMLRLEKGHVVQHELLAADGKDASWVYTYRCENGVEYTEKTKSEVQQTGTLTYGEYSDVIKLLMQRLNSDADSLFEGLNLNKEAEYYEVYCYQIGKMDAFTIRATQAGTLLGSNYCYGGYYQYDFERKTLQKGAQVIDREAEAPKAIFSVTRVAKSVADGGGKTEWRDSIYLFLEQ